MSRIWSDDADLFAQARRELFTAVVGDAMDRLGLQRQFLPPAIHPLTPDMVTIGRALPVLEADLGEGERGDERPFGLMLEALDDLQPNEVYVCTGASPRYALWGELMSTRAMRCGAAGAVVDGYHRDTRGILKLAFPVFSQGAYAQDQGVRGKVVDFRVPIEMAGARVEPGDIVFGDLDGVCVVPSGAVEAVFPAAFEKARGEKAVRQALEAGMPAREAFARFGIL